MTAEIKFRKSTRSDAQFVYADDILIGTVKKVEHWTVRGTSVKWDAQRKGRFVGSGNSRKEAAELLCKLERSLKLADADDANNATAFRPR